MNPNVTTTTTASLPAKTVYAACVRALASDLLRDDARTKVNRIMTLADAVRPKGWHDGGNLSISADDFILIFAFYEQRTDDVIGDDSFPG